MFRNLETVKKLLAVKFVKKLRTVLGLVLSFL